MILRTPVDEPRESPRIVDDREPRPFWHEIPRDRAHPLLRGMPSDAPAHRHTFDALIVYGQEIEQFDHLPGDGIPPVFNPTPPNHREFRMNLTCTQCGQIIGMQGLLTADDEHKRVEPVPLRAKHLQAQHTSTWGSYRDWSSWLVYDDDHLIGAMTSARTPRGRDYVEGYVDDEDGARHSTQAPTAIGVLRKLASAHARRPAR